MSQYMRKIVFVGRENISDIISGIHNRAIITQINDFNVLLKS